MCDKAISADTMDNMLSNGWDHVKEAHPEMAKNIEAMPESDPKMIKWREDFKNTWDATPEDK